MKIPGFDILDRLGEGGMAVVWKAYQISLERIVAIKILKSQFADNPNEVRDFILEARSAAKLKHPNVVQVYDISEIEGTYYFVMEYVAGLTVARMIENKGPLPQKMVFKIARYVAEALEYAWNKSSLIHRDIKPDNIMIDEDETVKLADLGLAKMAGHSSAPAHTQFGVIEGTPNYMSPEQAKFSAKLDCRTDMYSLGASLYHMVTGIVPFDGHDPAKTLEMHLTEHVPNPKDINPAVTAGMAQFITKLMMKDPKNRYVKWADVAKDVQKISAGHIIFARKSAAEAEAESTVSPSKSKATVSETVEKTASSLPAWMPKLAWALIFLWWAIYLGGELKLPAYQPHYFSMPAKTTIRSGNLSNSQAQRPAQTHPANTVAEASPRQAPVAQTTGAENTDDDKQSLAMMKMNVANCLLAEDFSTALFVIGQEKDNPHSPAFGAELERLRKFTSDISAMPAILENTFRNIIGQEVVITRNKQPRKMIVRAISGGTVNAALAGETEDPAKAGSVTFALSQLDPIERNKWLGAADTPAKCAMKYILYMKGGDYASAKTYAANCGPFSECFINEVEARSSAQ